MALLRNISLLFLYFALNNLYFVSGDHGDTSTFVKLLSSKSNDSYCDNFAFFIPKLPNISYTDKSILQSSAASGTVELLKVTAPTAKEDIPIVTEKDPMAELELMLNEALFGINPIEESERDVQLKAQQVENSGDTLAHFPSGQLMRAELYENKSGVHLPEYMHKGHSYLKITPDYMQTAVNAFKIFLDGTIEDVLRLPSAYVLHSARTISMMQIAREKLVATWTVIKAGRRTSAITHETLELYRPLFKYVNGHEIAKLNLSDERILSYIGTHADLDRHQVGVVASKYIRLNRRWNTAKYLNLMNNLICGVPLLYMRMLGENTYLQLSHQLFYHIRSCDPLQRRFYLHLMTRTQVMGKSNSWGASDVARLGLLLTEVDVPELSAIPPKAMAGLTAQVMLEMQPQKLKALSEPQLKYIAHKPLNILAKKLHKYQDTLLILNCGAKEKVWWILLGLNLFCSYLKLGQCLL